MPVEILIGNIASGKSTFCTKKAAEGAVILNDDSLVKSIHADNYLLYNTSLKPLYKNLENQILIFGVVLGKDVIVDRSQNVTRASRRRFISMAHSLDTSVSARVFPFEKPEEHARRRAQQDLRGYSMEDWLKVAERFNSDYESPSFEEGFDSIHYEIPYGN